MAILLDPARTAVRTTPAHTGTAAELSSDALYVFMEARGRSAKLCALSLAAPSVSVSNVVRQTALLTHGRLRNPAHAEELGRRGRHAVEETYNWISQYKKLRVLYADLAGIAEAKGDA
jgi:hypothetical protein